jgi:hypothetical protein
MNSVPNNILEYQRKMVRALRKGVPRDEELADQLRVCNLGGGSPCWLPMCPVCVANLRLYIFAEWVKGTGPLFSAPKLQFKWFWMAVPGGRYPLGQLDEVDLPSIYRRIQRQHERVGFPLVFSAVDISLIEDSPREIQPFWQAGVYSMIFGSSRRVQRTLKDLTRGNKATPFGVYLPESIRAKGQTEKGQIKGAQMRELARCLARYDDVPARCVLTGCQQNDDGIELDLDVRKELWQLAST